MYAMSKENRKTFSLKSPKEYLFGKEALLFQKVSERGRIIAIV